MQNLVCADMSVCAYLCACNSFEKEKMNEKEKYCKSSTAAAEEKKVAAAK